MKKLNLLIIILLFILDVITAFSQNLFYQNQRVTVLSGHLQANAGESIATGQNNFGVEKNKKNTSPPPRHETRPAGQNQLPQQNNSPFTAQTAFFFGVGYRPLKYGNHNIYFDYIDESPSQDHITTYFQLAPQSNIYTIHGGIEHFFDSRWTIRMSCEYFLNRVKGGGLDLGLGYILGGNAKITLNPSVGFGMNWAKVRLGDIYQNDLYIQVNETKFYSESVSVAVSSPSLAFRPEMAINIPLSRKAELRLSAGYHLKLAKFSSNLKFNGDDETGASTGASKPLEAANANLLIDGTPLRTSFAKLDGLYFNVCLGFRK